MSLDPRDSQRRGRSKSPGRQRERSTSRAPPLEVERETVRERSRVRVPSPPSARGYEYDEDDRDASRGGGRGGGSYQYEERETVTRRESDRSEAAKVVTAEPRRGGGDPRSSYGSLAGYGRDDSPPRRGVASQAMDPRAYTDPRSSHGSLSGRGGRERDDSPLRYPVPGGFQDEDTKVRYESGLGRGGGREKEYYSETRKETYRREEDNRDGGRYGRAVSPPRDRHRYESEIDKHKFADTSDPRRSEDSRDNSGRERGASFNISAGHHSVSGGIALNHGDRDKRTSYVAPPSPTHSGYQPPYGTSSGSVPYPEVPGGRQYAEPAKWEYAQPDEKISYTKMTETTTNYNDGPERPPYVTTGSNRSRHGSTTYVSETKYSNESPRSSSNQIVTVEPGGRRQQEAVSSSSLAPRMHSLSVSTGHHGGASLSLANAPGSPLLEAYQGTYQSISPMPSPLMIASQPHGDLDIIEALSPESSGDEGGNRKARRKARFHDPAEEATILARALKGEKRAPDTAPLIEILPGLTHEQMIDLRVEYKLIVKTGSEKKGVNIAKHIKLRMKEEDPNLMKACYACALGKWESEAYWANFWYQGEKSRRELLIESLMGRTNKEIREIKDGFSDKKYSDSLTKCMKMELKEDKFKKAVLLVLEEKKMEESRHGLDRDLLEDDVHALHKAVRSEKGGESAMINIIVVRSDSHMREVLRAYERTYNSNFAREMLKKSGNLVGELLAHILNGVINKPVRDALLVHHALSLSKSDSIRTELLISRLIRYHWDRPHMEAVKREYRNRYGVDMQVAVREGTRGEWGRFCEALCMRRMGDEVKMVERVERVERVGGGGHGHGHGHGNGREEYYRVAETRY